MAIKTETLEGTVKKELHIFYVLDTSGSMTGAPIGALNDGMRSTVEELKKKDGEKADLKIAVLEFNSNNRWVTVGNNGVEDLQDFVWTDLNATGLTRLGGALRELNKSLSRNDKMHAETGNKVPVVIFMSDGEPNDDWEDALKQLAENKWYRHAIKIAFALGDHADADVLAKVVGVRKDGAMAPDYEAVLKINDLQVFAEMIQVVSVSSALAASTSQMIGTEVTGRTVVGGIPGVEGGENRPIIVDPENDPEIYTPIPGGNGPCFPGDDDGDFDVI